MTVTRSRPNCYATLGVASSASQAEIARAFRKLAKDLHPDRDGGDARRFVEVSEAWAVIGDAERRSRYDRELAASQTSDATAAVSLAVRRAPKPPTRRGATLMVWSGLVLSILGLVVAAATVALVVDGARFRSASTATGATVVEGAEGREVRFTTESGEVIQVPEPDRANPGVRGDTVAIRYDNDDPTRVRVDESTAARDITFAIVAMKLLVGGPVLMVVGARRRGRIAVS